MVSTLPINSPWHALIEKQAKNSFYYDQRWLDILTTFYGYHITRLTTTNGDGLITGFFHSAP